MKFKLGQVVMTNGVANQIKGNEEFANFVTQSFTRYVECDWGNLCEEDKAMNDSAITNGDDRIFAKYTDNNGESIYIITEWDRSATTILFPSEY